MPNNKRKGGKSARERRRIRRAQLVNPSSSVYGKVTPMIINFYGRYELTDKDWTQLWGMKSLHFGNSEIFSGPYAKLKIFREYHLVRAHFKLTHEVIRSKNWKKSTHSELSTYSVATFIQDYDVSVKETALVTSLWDEVCSHPGVKNVVVTSNASKTTHHTWVPTEPSDMEWRLTDNDGLCHVYMLSKKLDKDEEGVLDTYGHLVSTVVELKLHIKLRGFDIQNDDTLQIKSPSSSSSPVVVLTSLASTPTPPPPPSPTFDGPADDFRPMSPVMEEMAASVVSVGMELEESFCELSI